MEATEEGELVRGCGQGYNGVVRRDKAMRRVRMVRNVDGIHDYWVTNGVTGRGRIGH